MIMLGDEMPGSGSQSPQSLGGTTNGIFLYVEDVDKTFNQAVAAGAKAESQPTDMFWGDRYGRLKDPFGHSWSVATHKEDVAPAEMAKRMKEAHRENGPALSLCGLSHHRVGQVGDLRTDWQSVHASNARVVDPPTSMSRRPAPSR